MGSANFYTGRPLKFLCEVREFDPPESDFQLSSSYCRCHPVQSPLLRSATGQLTPLALIAAATPDPLPVRRAHHLDRYHGGFPIVVTDFLSFATAFRVTRTTTAAVAPRNFECLPLACAVTRRRFPDPMGRQARFR